MFLSLGFNIHYFFALTWTAKNKIRSKPSVWLDHIWVQSVRDICDFRAGPAVWPSPKKDKFSLREQNKTKKYDIFMLGPQKNFGHSLLIKGE